MRYYLFQLYFQPYQKYIEHHEKAQSFDRNSFPAFKFQTLFFLNPFMVYFYTDPIFHIKKFRDIFFLAKNAYFFKYLYLKTISLTLPFVHHFLVHVIYIYYPLEKDILYEKVNILKYFVLVMLLRHLC